ncbi:MAG: adenine phosphoribosyltransferase [Flavobacteriales bacterium]|jgi:adenine phosphoribosyltransferase
MNHALTQQLMAVIADVPDFPKPGIVFKDITPLLADHAAFSAFTNALVERYTGAGITQVVGIESRGFIFGAALAHALGCGMTLVRKPGKLPRETRRVNYDLEDGTDTLHIHADALDASDRVIVIDDVLATGGTAAAAAKLVESTGAAIHELTFLMELGFLNGRDKLEGRPTVAAIVY